MLKDQDGTKLAIHFFSEIIAACQKTVKMDDEQIVKHISWFSFSKLVRLFE